MPVSRDLPYQWWDTPNIHLCTIQDFRALCREEGLRIEHELYLRSVDEAAAGAAAWRRTCWRGRHLRRHALLS